MRSSGADFRFSSKAKKAFEMYNWEGNIRELKNYIEFLGFTEEKIIEFEDMPLAIREYYEEEKNRDRMEREQGRLRKIDECCNRGESSGRQKLLEVCKQQEILLTEQEIRGILKKLEDLGFIEVYKGRRGNKISNKGREFLEKLD